MNRVEELKKAGRSYARAWKEFIEAYEKDVNRLYCFFEGQDDPRYYNPRIEAIVFNNQEQNQVNLWCEGKDNVIALFHLLKQEKRFFQAWVAFFIDKDFDDFEDLPDDESVYVTYCYSVENFYLNITSFKKILRDEFWLPEGDVDFERTIRLFIERLEDFNNISDELNAWIFLQKQDRKKLGITSRLGLRGLQIKNLFGVSLNEITKDYSIDDLERNLSPHLSIDKARILEQIEEFRKMDRAIVYRGKYLIYFLSRLIKLLSDDRNSRSNRQHFSQRSNVELQLSANVISELSQYAETPPCLKYFLENLATKKPIQLSFDI